jgi:tripartite-type tricarboxylate transporter receptor subunit TctC
MKTGVRPRFLLVALATAAVLGLPVAARCQAYPTKPVRLIVPIVPGGSVDLSGRRLAQKLSESLGRPVVVENVSGASGTIGASQVARSAPDGYTLMWCTVGEMIVYRFLSRNQPYDAIKDFTPLMAGMSSITVLASHPSTPGTTLAELIAYARANPGKLTYASAGIGSYFHLAGELFKQAAGVDILHVPYKGAPPAMTSVATGQVKLLFISVALVQPFMGKVKILALNETERHRSLPDVPTVSEVLPNFEKLPTWYAFFGPAGMSRPIIARLNAEMNKALVSPEVSAYIDSIGFLPLGGSPHDLAAMHAKGMEIYARAIRITGLKPE